MTIRLRLTFCYVGLFSVILLLITLLSYAIHARGEYDNLDRTLLVSVDHAAAEATSGDGGPHLVQGRNGLELALRLFSADGVLQDRTLGTEALPSIDPRGVLRSPAGPAYDVVTRLIPPILQSPAVPDPGGTFGLFAAAGQRWRVYVLTLHNAGTPLGYIEAVTPLGRLDNEIQTIRIFLPVLGLTGLALALFGSWAIAGRAFRPVDTMIRTARTITLSHDLSSRLEAPPHRDELARLADTFNEMLASLEAAHHTQKRFISDASHELRAPLTTIQGNLELLRRQGTMSEPQRAEALVEVEREASRMTRLVADLLVLARADAGVALKRCPVDLDALVLEVFREARHLAQGQRLVLDPFEPARVEGDEDRLKQLFLIFLDNALKYTPASGQVTIGLQHKGADAEVIVRDTGVGIPAGDLPHVFERFYRADPARGRDPGGTGLGLAIAQWIVEQHEGTIQIKSKPGQGTTVMVRLPLCLCP